MRRVAIAIDLDWPVGHHQGVASGILKHGRERGWSCEIDPFLGRPGARPARYDGVIGRVSRELASWAARTRTPVVNVWVNSPARGLPEVAIDHRAAGALAARHLLDLGHRAFGFLGWERDVAAARMLEGFRSALGGFTTSVLFGPAEPRGAKEWLRLQRPILPWVSALPRPAGVLASVDVLARYLSDACLRAGLRVPDDVAIVGSGNTALLCDLLEPTLSSIEPGFERVGRRAAELLERLMAGRKAPRGPVLLPPARIVARRSTDRFAVGDPAVAAALRSIWARSGKPVRVSEVLEDVPIGRRTLERRFREALGRTLHDEIRRAHVERSRRLLVETREPLKIVARRAGFRDPQQLSRVFRSVEGVTPQEYRRIHAPE